MTMSTVKIEDVRILTELTKAGDLLFVPIPPHLLPGDISRRVGFDGVRWKSPPVTQVIDAVAQSEPMDYYSVDYHYVAGRLHLSVDLPYGGGVKIYDHHPTVCSSDFRKGLFFAISRMDELRSDVRNGMETAKFSSEIILSWDIEEIVPAIRRDWMLD